MVVVADLFGDAEVFAGLDGCDVEVVCLGDAIDRLLDVRVRRAVRGGDRPERISGADGDRRVALRAGRVKPCARQRRQCDHQAERDQRDRRHEREPFARTHRVSSLPLSCAKHLFERDFAYILCQTPVRPLDFTIAAWRGVKASSNICLPNRAKLW